MMSCTLRSTPAFAAGGVQAACTCRVCGADCGSHHFLDVRGVCPGCCHDHDYEYDRYERGHFCVHCGDEQEYEPSEDDSWGYERTMPIGTPISQLSGRPGAPGFAEFESIARSWGFE